MPLVELTFHYCEQYGLLKADSLRVDSLKVDSLKGERPKIP